MTRALWEYKVVELPRDITRPHSITMFFNEVCGDAGWELVSFNDLTRVAAFKRPKLVKVEVDSA